MAVPLHKIFLSEISWADGRWFLVLQGSRDSRSV